MMGKREKNYLWGVRAGLGFGVKIGRNGGWALGGGARGGSIGFD